MRWWRPVAALTLGCLALALAGAAETSSPSVPTTLYLHVVNMGDFAMNTQRPDDSFTSEAAMGLASETTSCAPQPPAPTPVGERHHTLYGYALPSLVDYAHAENGRPRVGPVRGLGTDGSLDAPHPVVLHWFLRTEAVGYQAGPPLPLVVPNVVVRATLREGEGISKGDDGYNSGALLARGASAPTTLQPTAPNHSVAPDGGHLYEFTVPLIIANATLPETSGINLRIDMSLDNPYCTDPDEGSIMPNLVTAYSDKDHRPRLEMALVEPVGLRAPHAAILDGSAIVHAEAESVWGAYDVVNATISITGPSVPGQVVELVLPAPLHCHCYSQPRPLAWQWNYGGEGAAPGQYVAHVRATNLQNTTTASIDIPFEVPALRSAAGTGAVPLMLSLLAGALAAVSRSRPRAPRGPNRL